MKNHTTPHKPVPKGWRLATDAELHRLPHNQPKMLTTNPDDKWSHVTGEKGSEALFAKSCWYAVRVAKNPRPIKEIVPPIPPASPIPDSGSRTNFDTGAVRDAASGKGLYSRIPPIAMRKLAKRFEDGAIKYPDGEKGPNWMQGIPLSRFYDAIQRHSTQAAEFDTSEDHLGAVLWNAAAWAWTGGEITAGRLPQSLNDLPFHAVNRHTGL